MSDDPLEALFARGVTDGLPVVLPTPERVAAAVAASGRAGEGLIGWWRRGTGGGNRRAARRRAWW
jgi:hypothetical protein